MIISRIFRIMFLFSLKPKFFYDFEHIFVKGTDADFASAAFFTRNTFLLFNTSSQRTGFVQQNREQKRGIKIGYKHKSKSVRSFFFVKSLKFFGCHFRFCIKPFRSFHRLRRPLRQTRPACSGFLNHPFNKTGLLLAFHREHHPIAEVYKPATRLGSGLCFFNGRLHNGSSVTFSPLESNIEKMRQGIKPSTKEIEK